LFGLTWFSAFQDYDSGQTFPFKQILPKYAGYFTAGVANNSAMTN